MWFKKINAVLATIGGEYGKVPDKMTYNVMARVVKDLMAGKSIGGTLATSLVQNIAIRVGPSDFAFEGPISITKNQRKYARKMGWGTIAPFEALYGQPQSSETHDADFALHGFSDDDSAVVRGFLTKATAAQRQQLVAWIKAQDEAPTEELVETAPAPVATGKAPRMQDALTIWVKEKAGKIRATGNLDIAGQKFSLIFSDFHSALDRIPDTEDSRSWRAIMAGEVANTILPVERNSEGIAARSTMSGLFAADDTNGYKSPIRSSTAVILEWDGAKPVCAHVYDGSDYTAVSMDQQTNDRFKGVVRFAA